MLSIVEETPQAHRENNYNFINASTIYTEMLCSQFEKPMWWFAEELCCEFHSLVFTNVSTQSIRPFNGIAPHTSSRTCEGIYITQMLRCVKMATSYTEDYTIHLFSDQAKHIIIFIHQWRSSSHGWSHCLVSCVDTFVLL